MSAFIRIANHLTPRLLGEYVAWRVVKPRRYERPRWENDLLMLARVHVLPSGRKLWVWGESGPLVLMVHGWEGRGTQLGSFVAPLLEKGFRAVAWDAPAHGASSGMTTHLPHISASLSEDLRAFGEEIHSVIAHSMGGAAALLAMENGGLRPQKITLIASPSRFGWILDKVALRHNLSPTTQRSVKRSLERRFQCPIEALDLQTRLWRPNVPVQVLHDEGDRDVSLNEARRLVDILAPLDFKTFRGLGHRRILRSAPVLERVISFLEGGLVYEQTQISG